MQTIQIFDVQTEPRLSNIRCDDIDTDIMHRVNSKRFDLHCRGNLACTWNFSGGTSDGKKPKPCMMA